MLVPVSEHSVAFRDRLDFQRSHPGGWQEFGHRSKGGKRVRTVAGSDERVRYPRKIRIAATCCT